RNRNRHDLTAQWFLMPSRQDLLVGTLKPFPLVRKIASPASFAVSVNVRIRGARLAHKRSPA
ncbi:MAG TPA: hypothetical protein VK356_10905, partial [Thermomicrobiales bacterium]|nr:hypothetical protein [Thermomicrobiales bacterium]